MVLSVLQDRRREARKEDPMLSAGSKAPQFKVKDHQGHDVALSDFAGRRVVLWFFPKADTPG
jgi:peroxiredoxin Q/BCP